MLIEVHETKACSCSVTLYLTRPYFAVLPPEFQDDSVTRTFYECNFFLSCVFYKPFSADVI